MMPMHVVLMEGWSFVENEGGAEGKTVFKPGWTSYQPGAKLQVELSTNFKSLHGSGTAGPANKVDVVVTYLSSYEHMGQAEVQCVSNCVCHKMSMDGHETRWKVSLPGFISLTLSVPHEKCVIQVRCFIKSNDLLSII
jgi:hypothetical protein